MWWPSCEWTIGWILIESDVKRWTEMRQDILLLDMEVRLGTFIHRSKITVNVKRKKSL